MLGRRSLAGVPPFLRGASGNATSLEDYPRRPGGMFCLGSRLSGLLSSSPGMPDDRPIPGSVTPPHHLRALWIPLAFRLPGRGVF